MRLKGKSMHLHIVYCLSKKPKTNQKKLFQALLTAALYLQVLVDLGGFQQ